MIRFVLRLLGYLAVAGGFVMLVIDGTRSIANGQLLVTSLAEAAAGLFGERVAQLQPAIERNLHPLLWDPVTMNILLVPAAAAGLVLGFLLLAAGRKPEPGIGVLTRE